MWCEAMFWRRENLFLRMLLLLLAAVFAVPVEGRSENVALPRYCRLAILLGYELTENIWISTKLYLYFDVFMKHRHESTALQHDKTRSLL